MPKVPITEEGLTRLKKELERLTRTERPAVIKAISEAREHGDLSENAEYHAAREKQSFVEGKIGELRAKISNAEVIPIGSLDGDTVKFGAKVTINPKEGAKVTDKQIFKLVGDDEADITKGLLGISSPLARAMVGKAMGDKFILTTPAGTKTFTIKQIEW